jgi:hypothetical protein
MTSSTLDTSTYLPISNIDPNFDPLFISDNDSVFNPRQANFYHEMNNALKSFNKPINEQLKQIQVNTYYYKKYKAENQILYFTIAILILVIIISIIRKNYPYLDDTSYSIIVGVILAFSLIYIVYSIWYLIYKDELNYDETDYGSMSLDDITSGSNMYNSSECNRSTSTNSDISYNVAKFTQLLNLK